jgi:transposase
MPRTYSLDFRRCVIDNYESGMSRKEILSIFKISGKTFFTWYDNFKKGSLLEYNNRSLYSGGKICPKKLSAEILLNPDLTLEELSSKFGVKIPSIWYRCKSIGITRKKNNSVSRKRRKKA